MEFTDGYLKYLFNNKGALEEKAKSIRLQIKKLQKELNDYKERIEQADRISEIYEDVPITTMFRIETVSDEHSRYAEHPLKKNEKWGFSYGKDHYIQTRENRDWTGYMYESREEAMEAGKRWVVLHETPMKEGA